MFSHILIFKKVQIEPLRFDPTTSTSDLGKISAFPRSSTILVSPEARKKWKPFKAKHSPYRNSQKDYVYGDVDDEADI